MDTAASPNGPTKFFFDDENVDRLFSMVMALGAEISAVSEKLDTVLALLAQERILPAEEVEAFEPSDERKAARDAARQTFIKALLLPFQQQADALADRAQQLKG